MVFVPKTHAKIYLLYLFSPGCGCALPGVIYIEPFQGYFY